MLLFAIAIKILFVVIFICGFSKLSNNVSSMQKIIQEINYAERKSEDLKGLDYYTNIVFNKIVSTGLLHAIMMEPSKNADKNAVKTLSVWLSSFMDIRKAIEIAAANNVTESEETFRELLGKLKQFNDRFIYIDAKHLVIVRYNYKLMLTGLSAVLILAVFMPYFI
jgi:hypothetical protein